MLLISFCRFSRYGNQIMKMSRASSFLFVISYPVSWHFTFTRNASSLKLTNVWNSLALWGLHAFTFAKGLVFLFFLKIIYLFAMSGLLVSAWEIFFSCVMKTLSCGVWDLVPDLRNELRAPCTGSLSHWSTRVIWGGTALPDIKIFYKIIEIKEIQILGQIDL